jgi:hypothetical protein
VRLVERTASLSLTVALAVSCGGEEFTAVDASGGSAGSAATGGSAAGGASGSGGTAGAGATAGAGGGVGGKGGTSSGGSGGSPSGGSGGKGGSGGGGGVVSACPSTGIEWLKESFSASLSTSSWSKYFFDKGAIDSVSGRLVAKPGTDNGHHVGIISKESFSLDGCALFIEVPAPLPPNANGETYLMAMVDSNMDAEITAAADSTSGSGLKLIFSVEENGQEDNQSINYSPSEHRWWRMRFPPGQVGFDTSPDGKSWTERRVAPRPTGMKTAFVELGAGTWSSNSTQPVAQLDNLNGP